MACLANVLFCRRATIQPLARHDDAERLQSAHHQQPTQSASQSADEERRVVSIPFVVGVSWLRQTTAFELTFALDRSYIPQTPAGAVDDARLDHECDQPLGSSVCGSLTIARIASNNKERSVTNTFRLTQTSSSAALFEFLTTDDGLIRNPPICLLATKHQPSACKPIWLVTAKKHLVFQTFFANSEDSGFGMSSWLADTIDIVIAPSMENERFYTLTFILKVFDTFECTRSEALNHSHVRQIVRSLGSVLHLQRASAALQQAGSSNSSNSSSSGRNKSGDIDAVIGESPK